MRWRAELPRAVLAAVLAVAAWAAPAGAGERRIVAVGDIHGAYDALTAILREADILDEQDRWAGGDAIFVQLGDFFDRGADSLKVARFLQGLQEEAPRHGGQVVVLLGNHEVMNLIGDWRYVTPGMLEAVIDGNSEKRRKALCKHHAKLVQKRARALVKYYEDHPEEAGEVVHKVPLTDDLRDACLEATPLGFAEYVAVLEPDQPLGRWLRTLPAVVRFGEVVFVHGGISPEVAVLGIDTVNAQVHREMARFDRFRRWLLDQDRIVPTATVGQIGGVIQEIIMLDEAAAYPADLPQFFDIRNWFLMSDKGPFWFRGYARWTSEEGAAELPVILESLGAAHVVVGHSTRKSARIETPFSNLVFLIDTGMLTEVYNGAPAALEVDGGRFTAIYLDERIVLHEAHAAADSR